MEENEILGKNLHRYRRVKEMTQKALAERVGLSRDSISKIELGKYANPGLKYLNAICRELEISIEELLMENPQKLTIEIISSEKNMEFIRALVEAARKLNLVK